MTSDPLQLLAERGRHCMAIASGWPLLAMLATGPLQAAPPRHLAPLSGPSAIPPIPPASIDEDLEVGGEAIEGRKLSSRMTVEVRLNDRGPFRFIVDSGADTSVISASVARSLALPAGTPVILNGTTASSQVDRVHVETLALGSDTIEDLELPVLEDRFVGADGLIGIDALARQRLMLDFEARQIRVDDAGKAEAKADGEIVVTARRHDGQLILTQAKADGKPVNVIIDTGSEVTIGNLALRDLLVRRSGAKLSPIVVSGVTGVRMNLEMAEVAELRLGPLVLQNVTIAFADLPPFAIFGQVRQPALLLGTDLMETFRRVSLDFRARKVRFQVRHCAPQSVAVDTGEDLSRSRLSLATDSNHACEK
jgi:predicted aspartyl protease